MKKILFLNTIHCKAWKNRALFLMLALVISIGNAWATYYASLKIAQEGPTGAGSVYVADSDSKPGTPNPNTVTSTNTSTKGGDVTMYWWVDINDGYYVSLSGAVTGGPYSAPSASEPVTLKASENSGENNAKAYSATAIFKPNVKITGASAEEIHATFTEDSQADKTCVAEFNVVNAESVADFVDPPTIGGENSDKFVYQSMSYTNNKVTINFVYNGNKEAGDHTATLTLKVINEKGGKDQTYGSKTITLIAHNEQEATDDAKVIAADGETLIYQGDWATAWTNANTAANAGCTLYLLRNVGGLTAYQEVKNTFTLDLNGNILSGKRSGTLIYLNTTGKTLTIKDSKTGGMVQHINNEYAGTPYCVNITKGSLVLESGTLYCENQGASGRKAGGVVCKAGTTFTMDGGKIDVWGYNGAHGISQESNKNDNTTFTMNGGEIIALGYSDIYGITAAGKVNVKDGATINATATYSNCRGITLTASANATAANCYYGQLTMTGGTINSTCTANADGTRYAYGIVLEGSYTASMGTGVATDGSHANKAAATGTIENATINVSTLGRYAYGVLANGSYQSRTNRYDVIQIKNTKIDVTSQYYYTYGVYANCGINGTNGGIYAANIELTNCDVTATTTKNNTAYCLWATTTATTIYKNVQPNYYGEYAGGATITVNSGTYTANTGATTAYAIGTSARAKTTYDSESNVTAERKLGGNAEGYATLNIHGGKFIANAGTTTARAVSNGGNCTIDGGEFYATAGSSTADGIYTVSGKLKASGVKIEASATGTVYGVRVDAANVPYDKNAAWTGFNYAGDAELNNLDVTVTARTGAKAYGVYLNAVSYQYTQSAFDTYFTAQVEAGKVTQANYDIYSVVFPGNSSYAIAGKAVINGGKYTVRAATTTAYAVHSAAKQVQGEKETAPSIVINSGKFWSEATSTYADISSACVPGYCVVKGGYYKNDAYITPVLDEGYNVFALQQNKEEHKTAYNEGYRWHVTNDFTGEIVCKVTHGSITNIYDKLESAFNYVNDAMEANTAATIILCANYTLPAGNYTIPSGVTLLIPYDEAYAVNTTKPTTVKADASPSPKDPSLYRKLTLEDKVNIVVQGGGSICVNAKILSGNTTAKNVCGRVTGGYGLIDMISGSSITLESGANLYCWGYIIGEGTIEAESSAKVYEPFQFADFRGGTASLKFLNASSSHKVFPYSQYYVQNIEVPLILHAGATETLYSGFIAQGIETNFDPKFVGSDGLFYITNGQLTKYYDKNEDRLVCTVEGNLEMNKLKISISGIGGSISSENYVLPITNNLTININSGTTTVNAEAALLAGTRTYIAKGATLQLTKPTYIYDRDNWVSGQYVYGGSGNQLYFRPLHYSGSGGTSIKTKRTDDNLLDAVIDVNGTLKVEDYLYTTGTGTEPNPGGADICSSEGTGIIQLTKGAGTATTTYQATQPKDIEYDEIPITPAQLHNDETRHSAPDNYTQTNDAVAGDEFVYSQYYGKWLKNPKVITWDATTNGGTCETPQTVLPQQETKVPELPIATKTGYTFKGWFTEASGGAQISTETDVDGDVTYYAQFEFIEVEPQLDIIDADGTNLTINANGWASSGWPYTVSVVTTTTNTNSYEKTARQSDRTLKVPYSGDLNADMQIIVTNTSGTVSNHIYKVPFVYTGSEDLSAMDASSIVFVHSGILTIDGTAAAAAIYVSPGAELNVTGTLTVGKLVLRTTPWQAAVLTNSGTITGQVYYSRITRDQGFHLFAIPAGSNTANVVLSDGSSCAVNSTTTPYGAAWQLREYNTARRAAEGATGANWDNIGVNGDGKTYSDVAIEASKGYELRSGSKYYREYLFPVTLPTTADSVGVTAATGAAGAAHAGWNILCSPYTYIYTAVYNDPARGIKVSWQYQELDGSYSYKQVQPDQIKPAVPFAYQTKENGSLDFSADSLFFKAPRRQSAAEALTETEWIHLDIFDAYGEGDETSLFVHPTRFEQTYKTGIDVAKQSLTASRAILYTAHAYGNMAFAGVADTLLENGIDVIVYSPTEQQLTFSLRENKFLNRLEYLWLADNKTGARTDLLLNDYTFRAAAGTDKQRFVLNGRFKAPQITTNITNTVVGYNIYALGHSIAISGVEQGTPIYVFDAVGHMIYTTAATSDEVIVPAPCAGVYMLSVGGQTAKLVINQ